MKVFQNKKLFKKLMIIFLIIMIFSFCVPKGVRADDGIGGKLLSPITSLFVGLGDGVMSILQLIVFHSNNSLIHIDTSATVIAKILVIAAAVILSAISIAACIITGGGAAVIALGIIKIVLISGAVTTITFPITTKLVEGALPDSLYLPLYSITPQEIFSNKIPLLDADFFNPTDSIELDDGTTMESTAYQLKDTVANWYLILRDIALVALLSILVYVGIRIIISTTSSDKAKYKQMLIDWLVAVCLLFMMHYIMAFSNILVEKIIDIVDSTNINVQEKDTDVEEPEMFEITDAKMVEKAYETLVEKPAENGDVASEEDSPYYAYFLDDSGNTAGADSTRLLWPAENFVQQARIKLQLLEDDSPTFVSIGWVLIYVFLVVETLIFVYTYLKRLVYMTFLTIIAPLVAMTYPLDKMNDGKAQAFNMWFKEYIFNLLIQPMHLILYSILITSAMDFASQNLLYVIVSLLFMVPAEKLIRKFFGFEKAQTPGLLGGPAGAALMMSGMNKMFKGPKPGKVGPGGKDGKSEDKDDDENDKKPRMNWNDKENAMIGSGNIDNNDQQKYLFKNEKDEVIAGADGYQDNGDGSIQWNGFKAKKESNIPVNFKMKGNKLVPELDGSNIKIEKNPLYNENNNKGNDKLANLNAGNDVVKNSNPGKFKRALKATKVATGTAARYYGKKMFNKDNLKKVGRAGFKATGALVGASMGAIAGIASGDPTKLAQYTAAGAIGGYTAAKNIPAPSFGGNIDKDLQQQLNRNYYDSDDEYDEVVHQDNRKNFQKDDENMKKLESRYGKNAKKIMNAVVPDYFDMGLDNIDDIMAAYELEKSGEVKDRAMAASTAKYASRIGSDTTKMSQKKKDEWKETFASEFEENDRVKDRKEAEDIAGKAMSRIDRFNKIKKRI